MNWFISVEKQYQFLHTYTVQENMQYSPCTLETTRINSSI